MPRKRGSLCSLYLARKFSVFIVSGSFHHISMRVPAKSLLSPTCEKNIQSRLWLRYTKVQADLCTAIGNECPTTRQNKVVVNYGTRNDTRARNEDLWRLNCTTEAFSSAIRKDHSFVSHAR